MKNTNRLRKALNTNSINLLDKFKIYVSSSLDTTDYTGSNNSVKDSLKILLDEFQRGALYRNNILRIGRRNCFKDYLLGLPSLLNIHFYYFDMYELFKSFSGVDVTQFETDVISDLYYTYIERAVNSLLKDNDMITLDELDIIE